jgi:alkanesulfonate monooxygenase SsuD/methylene tetrahydromethanopterin reductase-like flavin-dependent oxidoreductase (luciferase family)
MDRPVRFGVTLPQIKRTWQEARDAAVEFDRLGYDSLWVCDHLYGVPVPNLPILEAWTQLAAIAAITDQAKLGTLVTPPFFRNPAVLAKQIATIEQIAPGRTIAGLGAGWFKPEFEQTGCDFPDTRDRLTALEEMIEVMKRMWTEEKATFEGRFYSVHEALCEPKPAKTPEILVGGGGEKVTMAIAARHADTWNKSQQCVVVIGEDDAAGRAGLEKARKIYGGHMGGALEEHGIWGSPERVIECIERHRALGVSFFVIEFFGRDTREPAQLFAETVMSQYS